MLKITKIEELVSAIDSEFEIYHVVSGIEYLMDYHKVYGTNFGDLLMMIDMGVLLYKKK